MTIRALWRMSMAKADRHSMGPGAQGKGAGNGAMTELPEGILGDNMVLSNRDKAQHSDERGLDGKFVQTEQYHDHAANRRNFSQELGGNAASSGDRKTDGTDAAATATSGRDDTPDRQQR
jgi:hypothetical protein